ncbi:MULTISPECIES: hypothetical protein [unclassified Variovorax]|jgi:hypothetical protein|nr:MULTISPECIES: hypothetical protein [unclassified Variovorax]RSZ44325.1 hypothetical protein EJO70_10460 [Variovorax sp. 553]RSZ45018.1 hypothetical protein EJO71_07380 [Variovorax sp. 679]
MTTFAERRKSLPLQLALEGRRWKLYQFNSAKNDQMNWEMKMLRCFISADDLVRWENGRQQVKRFIESDEVLSSLVKFVQADEVGEDYLIHAKPPYDGGYSLAMLHDWRAQADEGAPPFGCIEAGNALAIGTTDAIAKALRKGREVDLPLIESALLGPGDDTFYFSDGIWYVYDVTPTGEAS